MTHERKQATIRFSEAEDEALKTLFGSDFRDLTAEGYIRHIAVLRRRSQREARQVERALEPFLAERVFRGRQARWQDTSEGLRARLLMLRDNPHLELDCEVVQHALGIVPGMLSGDEPRPVTRTPWYSSLASEAAIDIPVNPQQLQGLRAGTWISVHREERAPAAKAAPDETSVPDLPASYGISDRASAIARASASTDLSTPTNPSWLRQGRNAGSPFDDAIARLCERHRLPYLVGGQIVARLGFRVLTGDPGWLDGISFMGTLVQMGAVSSTGATQTFPGAHSVVIAGIDEFWTKSDWDDLYSILVPPLQESLLRKRGNDPQGRLGPDLPALKQTMPIYRRIVIDRISISAALNREQLEGTPIGKRHRSVVSRRVSEITRLLKPTD
jgi:hypothetical protein